MRLSGSAVVFLLLAASEALAGTVVSGDVSGVWSPAGSPYWVEGDLRVPAGETLAVQPGVEVRFRGPYRLLVSGCLQAQGTETDSILFTWDVPEPAMEWRGIRLIGSDDQTELAYCRIERVRSAPDYPEVRGGAVYCESCAPTIRHCLMQHNVSHNVNANGMGGGVACVWASPLIEFCEMRANQADSGGGIATIEECTPVIRRNRICDNTAPYCGGGIYAGVRSSPVIDNNILTGNRAYGWGGGGITLWNWYAMNHISKTVRNNVVADNWTSSDGGGFYIRYDYSILDNNTVVDNEALGGGGGIYVLNQGYGDYPPYIHNFIVWDNAAGTGPSIHLEPSTGSAVIVAYSDIAGGWTGTGNIDADPEFIDGAYHLAEASDCIDAGDPDPAHDDECFPPSQGTVRNDMGAYGGPLACQWPPDPAAIPDPNGARELPDASAQALLLRLPTVVRAGIVHVEFGLAAPPLEASDAGRPATRDLQTAPEARLELLDVSGRCERQLFRGSLRRARNTVRLNGSDLAVGIHFVRLQIGRVSRTAPLLVIR